MPIEGQPDVNLESPVSAEPVDTETSVTKEQSGGGSSAAVSPATPSDLSSVTTSDSAAADPVSGVAKPKKSLGKTLLIIILILILGAAALAFFRPDIWQKIMAEGLIGLWVDRGKVAQDVDVIKQNSQEHQTEFKFANYPDIKTVYTASLPDYQIAVNELSNLTDFQTNPQQSVAAETDFIQDNLNKLTQVHSFVMPEKSRFYSLDPEDLTFRTDDWVSLYTRYAGPLDECDRRQDGSVFVSTDLMTHIYFRILERQMEYLDQMEFAPRLKLMTDKMLSAALQKQVSSDKKNQASWDRVTAYLAVAKAILNNVNGVVGQPSSVGVISDDQESDKLEAALTALGSMGLSENARVMATQELTAIFAADSVNPSAIFADYAIDKKTFDYTQFNPRSYYNKNSILRSYFRAMMWYGRVGFNFDSAELTQDALNLTSLMTSDEQVVGWWQEIYDPTAFLVGTSDDLSYRDYAPFVQAGKTVSAKTVSAVQAAGDSFIKPQIMSDMVVDGSVGAKTEEELKEASMGWRLMGQRLTPDGLIFDRLTQGETQPDPITGERLPSGATATMVAAALGSQKAEEFLSSWTQQNFPDSQQIMRNKTAEMKEVFAGLTLQDWTQNAYWTWMYLYKTLMNDQKDWTGYPRFMAFDNWRTKDLNTVIGSWTELKHMTLLYAKQTYAELGGGPGECEPLPVPRGYVEPNIEFYDRLESSLVMVQDGLNNRGLLNEEIGVRLSSFRENIQLFREIAVKELANQPISDAEFEELHGAVPGMTWLTGVLSGEQQTEKEARSALVADVHTDAVSQEVVYEATGIPQVIYVAVKDTNGTRLTKGLVYGQYEFMRPLSEVRLNDQEWWKVVYGVAEGSEGVVMEKPDLSPWSSGF